MEKYTKKSLFKLEKYSRSQRDEAEVRLVECQERLENERLSLKKAKNKAELFQKQYQAMLASGNIINVDEFSNYAYMSMSYDNEVIKIKNRYRSVKDIYDKQFDLFNNRNKQYRVLEKLCERMNLEKEQMLNNFQQKFDDEMALIKIAINGTKNV